jgi:hypothetical protein
MYVWTREKNVKIPSGGKLEGILTTKVRVNEQPYIVNVLYFINVVNI